MKTRVRKKGNSRRRADDVKLHKNSAVDTTPVEESELTLDALVAQITEHNRHDEVDTAARAGNEIW